MHIRTINISKSNSFFLFGARSTGKTTLLNNFFKPDEVLLIDLLDYSLYSRLTTNPEELNDILLESNKPWCLIDEIQKVPSLLDIVHSQIEKKKFKFALTGSSARKLKRESANLLGGRAFLYKLFPLTHLELGSSFNLDEVLNYGSLAKITEYNNTKEKILFLKSYVETYLKEEILVEQIIRSLPPFKKFIELSAINDTEIINYSNIARDIRSNPKSVSNYYAILEDTLLGFFLEPYHKSIRKRQKNAPKFYWFDTGVRRALAGTIDTPALPKSYEYGSLFENFIINEIYRLLTYAEKSFRLSYLRVDNDQEIDLIIERANMPTYLVEIKSTDYINSNHVTSLELYHSDFKNSKPIVLSRDKIRKKIGSVTAIHWKEGIKEIIG